MQKRSISRLAALASFGLALAAYGAATPQFGSSIYCGAQEWIPGPWQPPVGFSSVSQGGDGIGASSGSASATTGSANAYADLSSGKMGVMASSSGHSKPGTATYSWANAEMWDVVTIFRNDSTATRIPLQLEIDGVKTANSGMTLDIIDDFGGVRHTLETGTTKLDQDILCPLTESFSFKLKYSMFASAGLWTDEDGESVCDFSHTLRLKWDLPAGMTASSASGVFAPPPITPVPEPASLTALGVGAAALLRRRKTR